MQKGTWIGTLASIAVTFTPAPAARSEEQDAGSPKPNIVFIYADDLGYGDLACYGSPVGQSPRLDRLASEGTRFTQFYVSHSVCSPTRASAMTGQWPSRHRIYGHIATLASNKKRNMPNWLDIDAPSLPRALQKAGYRTALIGKWHLGGGSGSKWRSKKIVINDPNAPMVASYGFDHVRATFGNGPTWKHAEPALSPHEIYPYDDSQWATWSSRAIADETIGFLTQHAGSNQNQQPFYVNVWLKDVHVPLTPTSEMRRPFTDLKDKPQVHYAMVRYMDQQIGRVLDTLDELGLRENTIVIFSSDNGAGKDRGGSNGALRGWKWMLYEGGIRVPLIVRWPGRIPADRVDEKSVLNLVDLIPTLCRLTGAKMREGYKPDGEDISDVWLGREFVRSKPQFWHFPNATENTPTLAIREGQWKLLLDQTGEKAELYDLNVDPQEANNVASDQPQVAARLQSKLRAWHAEVDPSATIPTP